MRQVKGPVRPAPAESDTNQGGLRAAWQARTLDAPARALLERDRAAFLTQSVSTPCLNTIVKAEGLWIEDTAGRRYMDFHGNNVHHVGYGHPRVVAAIKAQLDALPFAPRRYTCEPSVRLAEELVRRAPFAGGKVLFTTGGSDALEVALKVARAATGRFKTISFWDAFHGAGFEVGVETNGTQPAPPGVDWICVSPKGETPLLLAAGTELKLVYPQPDAPPDRFIHYPFRHFSLQPMDGPAVQENTAAAIAYCLAHPQWHLSMQTHKSLGLR